MIFISIFNIPIFAFIVEINHTMLPTNSSIIKDNITFIFSSNFNKTFFLFKFTKKLIKKIINNYTLFQYYFLVHKSKSIFLFYFLTTKLFNKFIRIINWCFEIVFIYRKQKAWTSLNALNLNYKFFKYYFT